MVLALTQYSQGHNVSIYCGYWRKKAYHHLSSLRFCEQCSGWLCDHCVIWELQNIRMQEMLKHTVRTAERITGVSLPSIREIFQACCRASFIGNDTAHPNLGDFAESRPRLKMHKTQAGRLGMRLVLWSWVLGWMILYEARFKAHTGKVPWNND